MLHPLSTLKQAILSTKNTIKSGAQWLYEHPLETSAGVLTTIIGGSKLAQSVGQSIFSTGLDDKYIGLSQDTDIAAEYLVMGGTFVVILCSRIPKMYKGFHHILSRYFRHHHYLSLEDQHLTHQELTQDLNLPRKIIYYSMFTTFLASGWISAAFIALNAVLSGATLMRKLENLPPDATVSIDLKAYCGIIDITLGSVLSWGFFNGPRLNKNARLLARMIVNKNNQPLGVAVKVGAVLVVIYTGAFAAYSIISTGRALDSLNHLFIHAANDGQFQRIRKYIIFPSLFPPIPTTLLTAGADLIKILQGKTRLFPRKKTIPMMTAYFIVVLAGAVDALLGCTAGLFGSLLDCATEFNLGNPNTTEAKAFAGTAAILSTPVYWANYGGEALKMIISQDEPEDPDENTALTNNEQSENSHSFWRERHSHSIVSVTSYESYQTAPDSPTP